ncbi:MAG: type I-C CRISPR-associated protein Cas5 [Candidatus Hydrogenedentes bacterium]|nr:type I-C CRISPR-associated protein Cas5 [Candidatus Hydrogenedentota bacterium]
MRGFCLEVAAPYACFTRPEKTSGLVSYDVITPSAARGIFGCIFWKPAIEWRIKEIQVLSPIRLESIPCDKVREMASNRITPYVESDPGSRTVLLLRDVKYRLRGEFDFIEPNQRPKKSGLVLKGQDRPLVRKDEKEAKYAAIFERRVKKGPIFKQPYLGYSEFVCAFRLVEPDEPAAPCPDELKGVRALGWMFYDRDYRDLKNPAPLFYRPIMKDGIIEVPDRENKEVIRR